MTFRKRKFCVQFIVNFNKIQHYTWLGTFGTTYPSTHTRVNLQKTFYIHCANLAFLLLLVLDYQPGPFSSILSLLLYSSFTFIIRIVFVMSCFIPHPSARVSYPTRFLVSTIFWMFTWFLPDILMSTRFSYRIFTWFLPDFLVSTRFLTKYLLDFYQIFLYLPDFLPDIYLNSTRFLTKYLLDFYQIFL